ncbi:MAG: S9 family peptidase, partial [Planctomycetota bacterium]
SPDGSKFAFTATRSDGVQLYIGDSETGRVRSITGWDVNLAAGGIDWLPDNRRIVAHLVPDRRDDMPERSVVPTGPVSQESAGRTSPVRTYQDLLEDEHDEAMFDWLMTSQIAVIDTKTRREKKVGDPAVYGSVTPSPDGEYLLVNRINRPYSYLVPLWSFPETTEVWTIDGDMVAEIADLPLQDTVPIGGVPTGRRSISWQANAPASLVWVEALDGGDPKAEAEHRDKVMTLNAPFTGQPKQFVKLEDRFSGVTYIDGGRQALAREYDRDSRVARTWLVDFSQTRAEPRLVEERNIQDRYADPGTPVTTRNEFGRRVALVDGDSIFMRGRGATPKGDRPFLHKMSLQSFDKTELWRNAGDNYETVVDLLPGMRVLTSYETTTTPPNY